MEKSQTLLPRRSLERQSCLTFSPLAWLKLQYFCHAGDTEIGGFGITAAKNLLHVEDFVTVCQEVTWASVRFDDEAIADFFDDCADAGLKPEQFARIWLHTHPGESVMPSGTDEETFARCFGRCDWAVMFIVGRTSKIYARLRFAAGPGADLDIPTAVDWSAWSKCCAAQEGGLAERFAAWQQEYAANIWVESDQLAALPLERVERPLDEQWWNVYPWSHDLDEVYYEPVDRLVSERKDDEPTIRQLAQHLTAS